jgi:hypothetical protein
MSVKLLIDDTILQPLRAKAEQARLHLCALVSELQPSDEHILTTIQSFYENCPGQPSFSDEIKATLLASSREEKIFTLKELLGEACNVDYVMAVQRVMQGLDDVYNQSVAVGMKHVLESKKTTV